MVGIILAVRALELVSGKNYWHAMERELFEPLGIQNVLPGGTGFSAENLARIGVLLDNHGQYGNWELFSEGAYQAILPTSLTPYFDVDIEYGIGLQSGKEEVFDESIPGVYYQCFKRSYFQGFLLDVTQVSVIPHIYRKGDNLHIVILLDPFDSNGGIETPAISQHYLFCHFTPL